MTSSNILNNQQKLDLASMIKANDTTDCTQEIREKKQSVSIKTDVDHLVLLKAKYDRLRKSNPVEFDAICVKQCAFLFNNYTDLYNKIKNALCCFSFDCSLYSKLSRLTSSSFSNSVLIGKSMHCGYSSFNLIY